MALEGNAVELRGVSRSYGSVQALRGLELIIPAGEVFGLIGPDGAGKTTTFHLLSGIMEASCGEALVFGRPSREARPQIGYLTQAFSLYLDLSVWENLRYIGQMRKLPDDVIRDRAMRYLREFDMASFVERLTGQLSGGMKQKLALACALITEPRLLLLDEPTTGVDPVSRREFWDTLAGLSRHGVTIVVATPYLDEAERCHRVGLMYAGQLHEIGTPSSIRDRLGWKRLEVQPDNLRRAEQALAGVDAIEDTQRFGDRLDVLVADVPRGQQAALQALAGAGVTVRRSRLSTPTLENVFVATLRRMGARSGQVDPLWSRPAVGAGAHAGAPAVGCSGLRKHFGDFVAVDDVTLEVRPGEIYGLLGANGAGKTTVVKMLCGLLEPTAGQVALAGAAGPAMRAAEVRERVGYMSQKFSLYNDLTIDENLDFFAGIYGVAATERADKKRRVLAFADLEGKGGLRTGDLPGGWKQRVAFGSAIMHEPDVLFLDEPTSGVDPIARRAFWRVINRIADRGVAVMVTTHYLEEAEQCNRLGLMVAGRLVAQGTPSELKATMCGHLLSLLTDAPQAASELLRSHTDHWRVSLFGERLHYITDEQPEVAAAALRQQLSAAGIDLLGVEPEDFSLEDVFIATVERERKGHVAAC
jgi:ABC-2 type transport system ATP-binding protein